MITTANTTQGNYASSHKVGVALVNCNDLVKELGAFIQNNDFGQYCNRCNSLLGQFIKEQRSFENNVLSFVRTY